MLQAAKLNKVYDIEETQAEQYAAMGYDIYERGNIVRHAANKTVPYAKYEEALAEIDKLKKQLAAAKRARGK